MQICVKRFGQVQVEQRAHLMPGAADDGGEHGPGRVVSGKASFAHSGPIVHNKSRNVVVTHVGCFAVKRNEPVTNREGGRFLLRGRKSKFLD